MSIRLSHSSQNLYLQCAKKYDWHYNHRIRSPIIKSSLFFGSAMDQGLNHLLESKDLDLAQTEFMKAMEQGEDFQRQKVDLPLNPMLKYSKFDFDSDLLDKADWRELFKYDPKFFETKARIEEELKSGKTWLEIPEEDRMPQNYASWLCMTRKGKLLLDAYNKEILPQIKEVLAVQMSISIQDEAGNELNGVIDAVVRLLDDSVAVLDNKTSSQEYETDSTKYSEQLAKYMAILNLKADDPEDPWVYKIDKAVYAVLVKKLNKNVTKVCKECGHIATGSHKTCDNHALGTRCGGEWQKTVEFNVKTQFIVDKISEEYQNEVLENATVVRTCIENKLFPKNLQSCKNQYGEPCQFIKLCYGGNMDGLVKLEKKND